MTYDKKIGLDSLYLESSKEVEAFTDDGIIPK